jgi:uncharacterized protein YpmB
MLNSFRKKIFPILFFIALSVTLSYAQITRPVVKDTAKLLSRDTVKTVLKDSTQTDTAKTKKGNDIDAVVF